MNFNIDSHLNINNTCKVGAINISFYELVELLGPPVCGPSSDCKTQCEWHLEFEDGTIATIYDYKQGDIPIEQINYWNIGGKTPRAYGMVLCAIEEARMDQQWINAHNV